MSSVAVPARSIPSTRWRLDPLRSRVEFRAKTFWGLATVTGRFSRYSGTLDLRAQPAIDLTIEAASLDTGHEKRDIHLRSPDFFDVERHPRVRFVSEAASLHDDRLEVRGRLYARGARIPLSLDAALRPVDGELEIEAVTATDYRALGMTWNTLGMLRGPSTLIVSGRLVRDD